MSRVAGGCAFSKDIKMVKHLNMKRPYSNFIQIWLISNVWGKITKFLPNFPSCFTLGNIVTEMI